MKDHSNASHGRERGPEGERGPEEERVILPPAETGPAGPIGAYSTAEQLAQFYSLLPSAPPPLTRWERLKERVVFATMVASTIYMVYFVIFVRH